MKYIQTAFLLILLSSCSQFNGDKQDAVYYYNLDSLLEEQKNFLFDTKPTLEKWAYVDGDTSENNYVPDTTQWKGELAFFSKMDINKPVLQDAYDVKDTNDSKSNLTVRQFMPKNPASVDVQYLKVYYLDNLSNLKKVEAYYKEANPIYKSGRHFLMEFDKIEGKIALQQFTVTGGQKMILKDSVTFKVKGKIKRL